MLGWLAPPGSPFLVLYGRLHPAAVRIVVETAFDKAETRLRGNEVPAANRMAVWLWTETTDFPYPQRWCGRSFGPNPTPAGDAWLELIREREIDGEYEIGVPRSPAVPAAPKGYQSRHRGRLSLDAPSVGAPRTAGSVPRRD